MNFPDGLLDVGWIYGAYAPLALIWLWCLRHAPWQRLRAPGQLNVWLGTIVSLTLLWSMKADIKPGQTMHLLGATAFTLMFGRQLAFVGLSVVLAAVTFNSSHGVSIGWQSYGLNALMMIAIPVFIARAILQLVEKLLPAHLIVYVLAAAFFGTAINVMLTGLASTLVLGLASVYSMQTLFSDLYPSYVLLAFAEAWITGALITIMVVYVPDWVGTFDDRRYLYNK